MGTLTFQAAAGGSLNLLGPNIAGTVNLTLPTADGTSGQPLQTNGSGTLSFANLGTAAGGTGLTSFTSGGVVYASSTSAITTSSALTFDGTNFATTGTATAAKLIPTGSSATGNGLYLPAANSVGISTNGTNAVYIDSSQNLLVGANSQLLGEKLRVKKDIVSGTSGYLTVDSTTTSYTSSVLFGNSNDTVETTGFVGTYSNNPFTFRTNNIERMRIDSSGNLLVGTTGQVRTGDRFSVSGNGAQVATFSNSTNTSGYSAISTLIQANGNNTSTYHFWGNTSGVGNWYLFGNGTTSFTSDARLKKNIVTTRDGYLEDICRLRVVKYNWKKDDDSTPKELGLIAQEVEQIFPSLVQNDLNPIEEGGEIFKQVKHSVLPFMLLKAIQEQQALITTLTARIEALEAK